MPHHFLHCINLNCMKIFYYKNHNLLNTTGPNLDKNSVQLSYPALFYEHYAKHQFDAKHLEIGLNSG